MKTKRIISFYFIFFFMLSFILFSPEELIAEKKILKVPLSFQETNTWCWAACCNSILRYFKKNIAQCSIANYAWSRDSCCRNPDPCNKGLQLYGSKRSIKGIFSHWCVKSKGKKGALDFWDIEEEIKLGRPFVILWEWVLGGGHFVIIRGYKVNKKGAKTRLYLLDPIPGKGHGLFSFHDVVLGSDHRWTHTLKNIKLTEKPANWVVTNSSLAALKTSSGYPYWRYNIQLKEKRGGCGELVKFHIDHYDASGGFISRDTFTNDDFPEWFVDCGEGIIELPRKTQFCSNGNETHLGGKSSGSVKWSFEIICDKKDVPKMTVSKRFTLPAASAASGMTYQGNFGKAKTKVSGDLKKSSDRDSNDGCGCEESSSSSNRTVFKKETKND